MAHESPCCLNSVDGPHQSDGFDRAQHGPRSLPGYRLLPMTTFEYRPPGASRMPRRKLFGRVALGGLALSSVATVAASTSLATAPSAGLTRLSLNENPLRPRSEERRVGKECRSSGGAS